MTTKLEERGITIAQLHEVFRLDIDTGVLYRKLRNGEKPAGSAHNRGYWRVGVGPKGANIEVLAHRVVFAMAYGRWPNDELDHINQNKLDNRPVNLREVTRTENMSNVDWEKAPRRSRNKSGFTGVHWHKATGKWCADIYKNKATINVGYFATAEAAAAARQEALNNGYASN